MYLYSDRIRTTVNVFGDCVGVGIVNHMSRKQLERLTTPTIDHTPSSEDDKEQLQKSNSTKNDNYGSKTESML